MINDLRAVITFFHKSTRAADALEAARKRHRISRGLEGIGKTRFPTICTAAISLKQCFPALCELVDKHMVKFPPNVRFPSVLGSYLTVFLESTTRKPV